MARMLALTMWLTAAPVVLGRGITGHLLPSTTKNSTTTDQGRLIISEECHMSFCRLSNFPTKAHLNCYGASREENAKSSQSQTRAVLGSTSVSALGTSIFSCADAA